jgi:hypothetical protein
VGRIDDDGILKFRDKRAQQEDDEQDRKKTGRVFDPCRLRCVGGPTPEMDAVDKPQYARVGVRGKDRRKVHCC